ncbi:hypothetical protein ACIOHE_24075 [Streptomyces sp. NPDC087851]|uniref:hypothetical protein n=1 Tax=Streptomyces sp. NPDC087851 TaxID=3365810 RepID=UPI00381502F0
MDNPVASGDEAWRACVRRATDAMAVGHHSMNEDRWDDVAIRDIISMVLYCLHLRDGKSVTMIEWKSVLWHLRDDSRVSALVCSVLPGVDRGLDQQGDNGDPAVRRWRWLTRTWDPNAPVRPRNRPPASYELVHRGPDGDLLAAPEPRWDGLSRGIGDALPDPAVEVCTTWAAHVVQAVITARHGGYTALQRVRVTSGPFKGQRGYVRDLGWAFDDDMRIVDGPAGYVVDLDNTEGTEDIDARQLRRAFDRRWPQRQRGSLKDSLPRALSEPLPRHRTCAEDLETVLVRACNPRDVSDELRQTIAAAVDHHHLSIERGACPEPNRLSWRVVQHWYQLTEHYVEGQIAEVWEVELKQHLHDPDPVVYLALSEPEAQALIAQRMEHM